MQYMVNGKTWKQQLFEIDIKAKPYATTNI